jgi:hypothetical protein
MCQQRWRKSGGINCGGTKRKALNPGGFRAVSLSEVILPGHFSLGAALLNQR